MNIINIDQFIKTNITRREVSLFEEDIQNNYGLLSTEIQGKSVLVVGGAGTIGSSFIKAILDFKPARLFVVDTNENGLTELTRDLRSTLDKYIPDEYKTYPMNFSDKVFEKMFISEGPFEIVANFAAHKHVRSEKDKYSIEAMLENNVFKAKEFLELLKKFKPEHFFCVSTDKAANPVNVMGASKKLMEEVIMSYSNYFKITTARFANVAFSNGSLLAGYLERIMKNQALACPNDIRRFFVSPEESGQICMLACILGKTGDIFFPKLAESEMVYFREITEKFLTAIGFEEQVCTSEEEAKMAASQRKDNKAYPVFYFNSDTSGEKTFEEFYTEEDIVNLEDYQSLGVIKNAKYIQNSEMELIIKDIKYLLSLEDYNKSDIVKAIGKYLPNFEHIETGKSLDSKM